MFLVMPASLAAIHADIQRRHAGVIRRAILRSYVSIHAACVDMADGQVTKVATVQANFTNELAGERTLRFGPLMKLNGEFWQWYPVLLSLEFGIPCELKHAMRFVRGVVGMKRMAKMGAAKVPQKRSA